MLRKKAGIFRTGKPAICGQPDAPYTIAAYADEIDANLYQVGYQYQYEQNGNTWNWKSGPFDLSELPVPNLPLPNAATAIMALGVAGLNISDMNIVNGLKKAKLPGRMQKVSSSPTIILDVAHNPHSAAYLVTQLQKHYPDKKIHCVLGMLEDKDISGTIETLSRAGFLLVSVLAFRPPCC